MDTNRERDDDDPRRREEEKSGHTDREREWGQSTKAELKAARDRLRACSEREAAAEAVHDQWEEARESVERLVEKSEDALESIRAELAQAQKTVELLEEQLADEGFAGWDGSEQ